MRLRRQPSNSEIDDPAFVRILLEDFIHIGNGENQLVVGGMLEPIYDGPFRRSGVGLSRERFPLFTDPLSRIKAGLGQNFVSNRQIGIQLDGFAKNCDRLFLLNLVNGEFPNLIKRAEGSSRFRGSQQGLVSSFRLSH